MTTLLQLRTGARQRADMSDDSGAVPDTELTEYVNEANSELYDLITDADEARLFAVNATKPQQVGDYSFRLPQNFFRMVSVDVLVDNYYRAAVPADPAEFAQLAKNRTGSNREYRPKYLTRQDYNTGEWFIFVFPAPTEDTLVITYWPRPAKLTLDSDKINDDESFAEFIKIGAAIRMLNKVERDATALVFARKRLEKRIRKNIYATDFNHPRVVRDLSDRSGFGVTRTW